MAVALSVIEAADPRPRVTQVISGPRNIRAVKTMRISVTDRCNFRCIYCMPAEGMEWVPRESILLFEEIVAIARAAAGHGIRAFKITGGEPLVRKGVPDLIAMLREVSGCEELSMTTNGVLLTRLAGPLRAAGLDRLSVSLDSLDRKKFKIITRGANLDQVFSGIEAALAAGFPQPKLNCVVMRGINDGEIEAFAALTLDRNVTVRFIEYMPLGDSLLKSAYDDHHISEPEIRRRIEARFGPLSPAQPDLGHGPASVWRLEGSAGRIGFISAMSAPFCDTCNRLRLTSEGQLRSCLFDGGEVELRSILRQPAALADRNEVEAQLRRAFIECVAFKPETHAYHGERAMSQIGG